MPAANEDWLRDPNLDEPLMQHMAQRAQQDIDQTLLNDFLQKAQSISLSQGQQVGGYWYNPNTADPSTGKPGQWTTKTTPYIQATSPTTESMQMVELQEKLNNLAGMTEKMLLLMYKEMLDMMKEIKELKEKVTSQNDHTTP